MRAIILAAGEGTRLRPFTNYLPKCLVSIEGVSTLELQLKLFRKYLIDPIIVVGYLADAIKKFSNNLVINKDYASTNMLYTLFEARNFFDEDIIISYGDIAYSDNTLKALIEDKEEISLTIDKNWKEYWSKRYDNPLDDLETLIINEGKVIEIGGKPSSYDNIQGQFMGLLKISKTKIDLIKSIYDECCDLGLINNKNYKKAYMTDFLQELIGRGITIKAVEINDPWIEIDSVSDYKNPETLKRVKKIIKMNS